MSDPADRPGTEGIDAALTTLREAEVLAFGGVGFAGQVLPATRAYRTLAALLPDRAAELEPRLAALVAGAAPAGRAYAATLLDRVDADVGRSAWASLTDQEGEFTTFQGCVMSQVTLADYARRRLAAG